MELRNLTHARRFAIGAVASNVALLLAAALALPEHLHVFLPILGLMLPLLTTALVESAAGPKAPRSAARPSASPRFCSIGHVAANGRA